MRFQKQLILELWNFIKSVIPSKHLIPPPNKLNINGIAAEDQTLISESFNNYFVEIVQTYRKYEFYKHKF